MKSVKSKVKFHLQRSLSFSPPRYLKAGGDNYLAFSCSICVLSEAISRTMEEGGVSSWHRFAEVSDSQEAAMLEQAVPDATKHATKFWTSVFNSFCHEKGLTLDLMSCSAVELDGVLRQFYAGLRTKTPRFYKRSSYLAARAGIQRHLGALV